MNTSSAFNLCRLLAVTAATLLLALPAQAVIVTYSGTNTINWFDSGVWDGDTWDSGDSAVFSNVASVTTTYGSTTSVAGLSKAGAVGLSINADGTTQRTMNFSGGTISGPVTLYDYVNIQGDFIQAASRLNLEGSHKTAYSGTATINNAGVIWFNSAAQAGTSSNFVVNDTGELRFRNGTFNAGSVTLNGSSKLIFGRDANNASASATITSLSGTGGVVAGVATSTVPTTRLLIVDQSSSTTFAGTFNGEAGSGSTLSQLQLRKQGAGDLTLTGSINNMTKETTITGGRLYINSSTTDFSSSDGSTAISVEGGTLGGTGTISVNNGDNVVLSATGKLAAGIEGAAGRTTYVFDTSSALLDMSAATGSSNTGWLKFELGAVATPGSTYDQILINSGTLEIGTGLNFDDFDFTALAGFGAGTYVLFDTPESILGTLGTKTGTIGIYSAELGFADSDTNLVLLIVPEPGTLGMIFLAMAAFGILPRKRKRT